MGNIVNSIIQNVADTLLENSALEDVAINSPSLESYTPSAVVILEDVEYTPADDCENKRWGSVEIKIEVTASTCTEFNGYLRIAEINESIIEALTEDPTRDNICCDLPIGQATEIIKSIKSKASKPQCNFNIIIKCHFEESC